MGPVWSQNSCSLQGDPVPYREILSRFSQRQTLPVRKPGREATALVLNINYWSNRKRDQGSKHLPKA